MGFSQDQLAEMLYVTRQSVSKWESGDAVPDLEKIVKMAKIFNVSLDNLILGKSEGENKNIPKIDTSEFVYDPTKNLYVRRLGKMNFWEFLQKDWWIIFIFLWLILGFIRHWY